MADLVMRTAIHSCISVCASGVEKREKILAGEKVRQGQHEKRRPSRKQRARALGAGEGATQHAKGPPAGGRGPGAGERGGQGLFASPRKARWCGPAHARALHATRAVEQRRAVRGARPRHRAMAGPQPPQQLRQQEQKQWRQQAHVQEHSPGPSPLPFKKRLSRSPSPGGGWVGWRLSPAYWLGDEGGGDASSAEGDAEAMAAPKTQGPNEEGDDGGGDSHGEGSPPAPFGWLSGLIDSPTRPSGSDGGTADNAEPSAVPPTRVAADSDTDEGEDIICGQPLPEQTGTAAEAATGAGGEAEAVGGEDACAPPVCSFCGLEEGGEAGVFLLVEAGGESTKAKGKRATRKRKGRAKGPEPTLHAHVECALWAPNCFQGDGGAILGVRSEIQRAQRLKCFTCKSGGAALGCSVKKCRKVRCGRWHRVRKLVLRAGLAPTDETACRC